VTAGSNDNDNDKGAKYKSAFLILPGHVQVTRVVKNIYKQAKHTNNSSFTLTYHYLFKVKVHNIAKTLKTKNKLLYDFNFKQRSNLHL